MWVIYIHFALVLLPLVLWSVKYKDLGMDLRILGFAMAITLLVEGYAAYLVFQLTRNLYLYHLLIPIQYTLFSLVIYQALEGITARKTVLVSIPLYLLIVLLITLHLQTTTEFNSYARLMKNALLACWTLLYYREVFKGLRVIRLDREPMFWISTGLFFYSLGSFFVDGLMNYLLGLSYEIAHTLYYISVFLGYMLYITFLIAFVLCCKYPNDARVKSAPS
ncbi:MAG: hypothetical protein LPK07_16100 [Hymenobacteraceae bacterium]|nr:hypothetical protein [Hymenobacteraceae bacterium]